MKDLIGKISMILKEKQIMFIKKNFLIFLFKRILFGL